MENKTLAGKGRHVYTVAEITQDIKIILENTFGDIWVEGEVSGVNRIATGTLFFTLKDSASSIKCVIFGSIAPQIKFELKDGAKILCFGRIGVYEKQGNYQFYAEKIEPIGLGSLQLALEQLKEKLQKEGLFAQEHKKPVPYLPATIGLVTSLQGAAIKDILKVLERRFWPVHIIIRDTRVQGEGAKDDIARAVSEFNLYNTRANVVDKVDVLIVGRGGGSIEDLWAFNEEVVARAIYDSEIPVISAVGHERDFTLADLVCDLRAPTPSVAAELVIPPKEELSKKVEAAKEDIRRAFLEMSLRKEEALDDLAYRLSLAAGHSVDLNASFLSTQAKKLAILNPAALIKQYKTKIQDVSLEMAYRIEHFLKNKHSQLEQAAAKISNLSPLKILARGYSITFLGPNDTVIKDAAGVRAGDMLKTRLGQGEILSEVISANKHQPNNQTRLFGG